MPKAGWGILGLLFLRFCLFCAIALTLAPLLAFIDARAAAFQAIALHLVVLNALLAVALLVYRRRFWAIAGMLAAFWNVALAWPSIAANMQAMFADPPPKSRALKVVSFNLSYDNPNFGQLVTFLTKSGADVIGLSEVTPEAKAALGKLKEIYPYSIDCIGEDRFCELMLLSKKPLRYSFAGKIGPKLTYVASADIDWQGAPLSVAVAHIVLPFVKPDWEELKTWIPADDPSPLLAKTPALWQSVQMAVLAGYARSLGRDQILMGDFNSTPWSDVQVAFRAATWLDNKGPLVGTWPADLPASLRVPIDSVFVGGGLNLRTLLAGPDLGSDHLPVIAEIGSKRVIAEAE
jgi:endonuclease/exonuclease/phosphatase (EEP) superfamily protein YafD